jgi:hypothetical protein
MDNNYLYLNSLKSLNSLTCKNNLEFNRNDWVDIVSKNNPYSDDSPSSSQYAIFLIFKKPILSNDDIQILLQHYNKNIVKNSENLYGPFYQFNLNIIADTAYNEESWNQKWKNVFQVQKYPVLYQVVNQSAIAFTNMLNHNINNNENPFKLSKHKVLHILKSDKTQYIKYILYVSLTQNIRAKMYTFKVVSYYTPNKIILGKAIFVGSGTTDTILLPSGLDMSLYSLNNNAGRPLNSFEGNLSKLEPESKIYNSYWKHIYDTNLSKYFQYNNTTTDDWKNWSTESMFPDKSQDETKCMNCL